METKLIVLMKNGKPIKMSVNRFNISVWADNNIEKDHVEYSFVDVSGLKALFYILFYPKLSLEKHLVFNLNK